MQEGEKILAFKPVASRPFLKSGSVLPKLLPTAETTPSSSSIKKIVAIQPKAARFRLIPNNPTPETASFKDETEAVPPCLPDNASASGLRTYSESTALHKPEADFFSSSSLLNLDETEAVPPCLSEYASASALRTYSGSTALHKQEVDFFSSSSLLNLEDIDAGHQENQTLDEIIPKEKSNANNQPLQVDTMQVCESSNLILKAHKQSRNGDKSSSDDGYNWRKYGQKQVKGSEHPRSYYKCSYPKCPVKKKVERSLDGRIAEIVYKGEHSHPKPQPSIRVSANLKGRAIISGELGKDDNNQLLNIPPFDQENLPAGRMDECSEQIAMQLQPQFPRCSHASSIYEDCIIKHPDQVGSRRAGIEIDKLDSRRRKNEDQVGIGISDPRPMMRNLTETGTYGDGFQWRKYGQKAVKGNAYPRKYYKCSNTKCSMRKYVEKASDDSGSFVTTYEGKHNHEMSIT